MHVASKDLAGQYRPNAVEFKDLADGIGRKVKERQLITGGGLLLVAASAVNQDINVSKGIDDALSRG
jgi:hypothetical protein